MALLCLVPVALPAEVDGRHLGVATCDSSNCHGSAVRQTDGNVWLNEYRIWLTYDYHSGAYKTLQSAAAQLIARKLGLESATTADICLNCHADNVPAALRGPKFQLSDGVSCEACHGGAAGWIDTHDKAGVTHADNVRNGMRPLQDAAARAQLCLGCHMGTRDRFATHQIMGAGHPRLSFELETFSTNQPPHFSMDADYAARKGATDGAQLWLVGQLESARRFLQLLQSDWYTSTAGFPELSFYDCQACHHGLAPDDLRWYAQRRTENHRPGVPRIADHHLQMLRVISETLTPPATAGLDAGLQQLAGAVREGPQAVRSAAQALEQWTAAQDAGWRSRDFGEAEVRAVRKRLIDRAASGREVDYGTAEQGLLGIVTLTVFLGEQDSLARETTQLFDALGNDETFRPGRYASAARTVAGRF